MTQSLFLSWRICTCSATTMITTKAIKKSTMLSVLIATSFGVDDGQQYSCGVELQQYIHFHTL
jgi:hypothetical protein